MSAHTFSNRSSMPRGTVLFLCLMSMFAAAPISAAPKASGGAYDLTVNVSILSAIPALVVPSQANVNFSLQQGAFNDSQTAGPLNLGNTAIAPLITLQTGLLNANTAWYPPSTPTGFLIVGSEASVADVDLGAVNPSSTSLLDVTANLVRSTAVISGYCPPAAVAKAAYMTQTIGDIAADVVYGNGFDPGNLKSGSGGGVNAGGEDSTNSGVAVSVNGNAFANLPTNPAPNTKTCLVGNTICLTLNEQTITGDGVSTMSVNRNGLHLVASVPGVVTADVVLAHSEASVACN
jgi:hypothetical protein